MKKVLTSDMILFATEPNFDYKTKVEDIVILD